MRVAFFGGSFDPPHRGHLAVATAAADRFHLDRILLAPTGFQPLKPKGAVAPFADRLAMTALLCANDARLGASELDAPRPDRAANYTVDTLAVLRAQLAPQDELFMLTGADAFLGLRQWRDPERLLASAEWIIVSRPGFSLNDLASLRLTASQTSRLHLLGGIAEPASATSLRTRLAAGESCADWLPPAITQYIQAHGLYGPTPPTPPELSPAAAS